MKNRIVNSVLVLLLLVGLGLVLYPSFSDYWNSFHQSRVIAHYAEDVANIDEYKYAEILAKAEDWNRRLAAGEIIQKKTLSDEEIAEYNDVLDPLGTGIIGYIEIPSIQCFLGIYHGTSEAVLQIATGHIEWSSLPVGGESTHTVISGHRGLPSAKLFTDLDKLRVGDEFEICVLGETYTYSVDQINIVVPSDMTTLNIVPGEDYCTLVTCTPYGINTHRLLVRGRRIETIMENTLHFTSEAMQIDTVLVAAVLSIPILLLLIIYIFISGAHNDAKEREKIKKRAMERILNNQSPIGEGPASPTRSSKKKHKKRKDDPNTFLE